MALSQHAELIKKRGFATVPADAPEGLLAFRKAFEDAARTELPEALKRDTFPAVLGKLELTQLNNLFRSVNYRLMDETKRVLRSFTNTIQELCGSDVYFQKRLYLRVNVPGKEQTVTPAHSDVFYGHSPHAFALTV